MSSRFEAVQAGSSACPGIDARHQSSTAKRPRAGFVMKGDGIGAFLFKDCYLRFVIFGNCIGSAGSKRPKAKTAVAEAIATYWRLSTS